ncbi:hypothetical protein AB4865_11670 [Capnocytophaga sp. ARDL2]|uniref:hypothetical protein n=1 Tax=Capnocytophaga sp. ARDL2 TaxID=3238809 RepID=UPI003555E58B
MLTVLLIALFILAIVYILAIIRMAKQRQFYRVILVHLIIFAAYLYIALHFERIFNITEGFGYQKLEFLVGCMLLQIVVGYYLVKNTDLRRKTLEKLKLIKKKEENPSTEENSTVESSTSKEILTTKEK